MKRLKKLDVHSTALELNKCFAANNNATLLFLEKFPLIREQLFDVGVPTFCIKISVTPEGRLEERVSQKEAFDVNRIGVPEMRDDCARDRGHGRQTGQVPRMSNGRGVAFFPGRAARSRGGRKLSCT